MKKIVITFSLLLCYALNYAQTTVIPDANFESALINLGLDTGPIDGSVPTANINGVLELDISYSNISDITGIEDFTALENLWAFNNNIASVDLSQNLNLRTVMVGFNNLSAIDVSNNTLLDTLELAFNQIVSLDISQNPELSLLNCKGNDILELDLSNNPELSYLNCHANNLVQLDVTTNSQLSWLDCSVNHLDSIDLSQNSSMYWLNCEMNELMMLDISTNTQLEMLGCAANNLSDLDLSNNNFLETLSCGVNFISHLNLSNNIALTALYCNQNQLSELDVTSNSELIYLFCNENELSCLNLKNGNNQNMDGSFGTYLDCTNNPYLTCIEVDDPALSLSYNWVKDATADYALECNNSCSTAAINENKISDLGVYPNPASNQVFINLPENGSFKIMDSQGRLVMETKKHVESLVIDVSALENGKYFLFFLSEDGQVYRESMLIMK